MTGGEIQYVSKLWQFIGRVLQEKIAYFPIHGKPAIFELQANKLFQGDKAVVP